MPERGRRKTRPSGDERQAAILAAAEELFGSQPFASISIEDIARSAGISRPNFYFYFASKEEVLLALLERAIGQVNEKISTLSRDTSHDPRAVWRESIRAFVDAFMEHRGVVALGVRSSSSDIQEVWAGSMGRWIEYSRSLIVVERDRGAAPAGVDARDLAVVLNLMNERVLLAAVSANDPDLEPATLVDTLSEVWVRSIYGTGPTT